MRYIIVHKIFLKRDRSTIVRGLGRRAVCCEKKIFGHTFLKCWMYTCFCIIIYDNYVILPRDSWVTASFRAYILCIVLYPLSRWSSMENMYPSSIYGQWKNLLHSQTFCIAFFATNRTVQKMNIVKSCN